MKSPDVSAISEDLFPEKKFDTLVEVLKNVSPKEIKDIILGGFQNKQTKSTHII